MFECLCSVVCLTPSRYCQNEASEMTCAGMFGRCRARTRCVVVVADLYGQTKVSVPAFCFLVAGRW